VPRDPIVEEMRRIKEEHAARFNYDIGAMVKSLREEQKRSGVKVVSYARKRPAASSGRKTRRALQEHPIADEQPARRVQDRWPVVFTAHSRHTAFMKQHICLFVLRQKHVPINPFMSFEYSLLDTVPRDDVRRGNNSCVHVADEVWTFGIVADGVLKEIRLARKLGKRVRHFSLGTTLESIREISPDELQYEEGVAHIESLERP